MEDHRDEEFEREKKDFGPKALRFKMYSWVNDLEEDEQLEIDGEAWDDVVSDHSSILQQITPHAKLLNWNIMTRGTGGNNGYNKTETIEEYKNRLLNIADEMAATILRYKDELSIITLQEVPADPTLRTHLLSAIYQKLLMDDVDLAEAWKPEGNLLFQPSMGNENFGMLTLFNKAKVAHYQPATLDTLTTQKGRVLITDFTLLDEEDGTRENLRIVNAHLRYNTYKDAPPFTPEQVQSELTKLLNSTDGQVIVAGDFNQELEPLSKKGKEANDNYTYKFYRHVPTSYSFDGEHYVQQHIDGIIFSKDPEDESLDLTQQPTIQKAQPVVQTEALTSRSLKFTALLNYFSSLGSEVIKSDKSIIIKIPPETEGGEKDTITIKKLSTVKAEFKASSSSDRALNYLIDAVKHSVPEKSTLKINIEGGSTEERMQLANKLWLNAVLKGFNVSNFNPKREFIEENLSKLQSVELHSAIKEKHFPAPPPSQSGP